jgi:hypothetical protein
MVRRRIGTGSDEDDRREFHKDFWRFLRQWHGNGNGRPNEPRITSEELAQHEHNARNLECWWGELTQAYMVIRDDANVEVIEWGMLGHVFSETGAGQRLYQLHESKHRGNGVLVPATFALRVGTDKLGYLDGQAILNLAAVLVSSERELKYYLSRNTYRGSHATAIEILTKRGLLWEYRAEDTTGEDDDPNAVAIPRKPRKPRPVLRAGGLRRFISPN